MRIIAYNLPKSITSSMRKALGRELIIKPQKLSPRTADPAADVVVLTITSVADADSLSRMPNLKALVTASTGTDHIDLGHCKGRGIEVKNCPAYATNAVAELAIALSFAGLRKLGRMLGFGSSLAYPPTCFYHIGSELSDKKCAVLGTGLIGCQIAKKLLALGCKVVAYSRSQNPELVSLGVIYLPIDQILKESDIIFVALPATSETHHLLGDKALSLIRDGSSIVNIARGEIVDSDALLKHIDRLGFFASDVIEGEASLWLGRPMKIGSVEQLAKKENFLLVPHIGASTAEAQNRLASEVLDTVSAIRSRLNTSKE